MSQKGLQSLTDVLQHPVDFDSPEILDTEQNRHKRQKLNPFSQLIYVHKIFVTQPQVSLSLSYVDVPLYSTHDFDAS